ncbi:DUF1353 domain-containing protein [Blastococcus sp. HT6-30]|uniref:DUF1353 domain-containing protein n=1 Tax=Blastococcus sp. HT6-30 TaxID=3144843 RepID=UPI003218F858
MPFEVGDVVVRRLDDHRWTVVEPLVYVGTSDRPVVPAGFVTDFATVPRVGVWPVPRFGRYTAAAILHDWPNRGCGRRPNRAQLRRPTAVGWIPPPGMPDAEPARPVVGGEPG